MSKNIALPILRTQDPLRVAIVSESPVVRSLLQRMLEEAPEAAASNLDDANVVVWDCTGDEAQPLAPALGDHPLPALAVVSDQERAAAALAAGARGVVLREEVGPSLFAALAAIRAGLTVLDPALVEGALRTEPEAQVPTELTARERQVAQLLAEGLSNRRIGKRLGISDHTAKFHVNSILTKLDADTRTQAVVQALRLGWITL